MFVWDLQCIHKYRAHQDPVNANNFDSFLKINGQNTAFVITFTNHRQVPPEAPKSYPSTARILKTIS
jgi:hypothetical protein